MYVDTGKLWMLGSATQERVYESSFGRGNSTLASRRSIAWSREHEAFLVGFQGDMLSPMSWETHPCAESGASAILRTCRDEYERFFACSQSSSTLRDTFGENGFSFMLASDPTPAGVSRAEMRRYPGFEFSFYGPNWKLETISLRGTLVLDFARNLARYSPRQIIEKLKGA